MRIGTRGSQLALWQARRVQSLIEQAGGPSCEIVVIRTTGDEAGTGMGPGGTTLAVSERAQRAVHVEVRPTTSVKRLFVKELEEALFDGRIDVAVHSSKDMPAELPPGLAIGATLPREDPRDALLLPRGRMGGDLEAVRGVLGAQPRIGTSSIRRVAQLRPLFTGAAFVEVRGNLDTRLRKLDSGEYDAIVLAAAGLRRLGHEDRISWAIPVELAVPAPGQGIIAVEHRAERADIARLLARIDSRDSSDALAAERALVHALGGGCQMPIGALATVDGDALSVVGVVIAPDGSHAVRETARGPRQEAAAVGVALAEALLRGGAGAILDEIRAADARPSAAP